MIKNYIKTAIRNLLRHKIYTIINTIGLSVGITVFLLILLLVNYELGYDTHYERTDDLYRVVLEFKNDDFKLASTPLPLAEAMENDIPGVEDAVRVVRHGGALVTAGDKRIIEAALFYADPNFPEVMELEFLEGSRSSSLEAPNSIVLSRSIAEKYFPNESAVGKNMLINNSQNLLVTGVYEDLPKQTHLPCNLLISMRTISDEDTAAFAKWNEISEYYTYVRLKEGTDRKAAESRFSQLAEKYIGERGENWLFSLQAVRDIHLDKRKGNEISASGSVTYLIIFGTIAFFILLLASINYINISTARYAVRAQEIGVRKTIGASRLQIAKQFLAENFIITGIAILFTLVLTETALPYMNSFFNRQIEFNVFSSGLNMLMLLSVYLFVGILSGLYPAIYLSALKPVTILKGGEVRQRGSQKVRQVLVVVQFAISMILIAGTVTAYNQLNYIQQKDLGYDKENVVVIPIRDTILLGKTENLKNDLLNEAGILRVSFLSDLPEGSFSTYGYKIPGWREEEGEGVATYSVDEDFIETMKIKILEGRNFSKEFSKDAEEGIIINKKALETYSLNPAIGKVIKSGDKENRIIGVIEDFNFMSLREEIEPLILRINKEDFSYILVRTAPGDKIDVVSRIEQIWEKQFPMFPFEHFFLDIRLQNMYESEKKTGELTTVLSAIAIVIACLGLVGLAAFTTVQRRKEIGVRKILGASTLQITLLLSKDFMKLVIISIFAGLPIAYWLMNKWLENYVFHIDLSFWLFLAVGSGVIVAALISVSYQAIKTANADPVESIRYE